MLMYRFTSKINIVEIKIIFLTENVERNFELETLEVSGLKEMKSDGSGVGEAA